MKLSFGEFPGLLEEKKVVMNSAWKEIWHTTYYFFILVTSLYIFQDLKGVIWCFTKMSFAKVKWKEIGDED